MQKDFYILKHVSSKASIAQSQSSNNFLSEQSLFLIIFLGQTKHQTQSPPSTILSLTFLIRLYSFSPISKLYIPAHPGINSRLRISWACIRLLLTSNNFHRVIIFIYCHSLVLILILISIKTRIDNIFGQKPPPPHHHPTGNSTLLNIA